MSERPVTMKVHPKYRDMLHLEAATHGESIIKFTEKISQNPDPLKDIAEEWRKKYAGKCKKQNNNYLDFP